MLHCEILTRSHFHPQFHTGRLGNHLLLAWSRFLIYSVQVLLIFLCSTLISLKLVCAGILLPCVRDLVAICIKFLASLAAITPSSHEVPHLYQLLKRLCPPLISSAEHKCCWLNLGAPRHSLFESLYDDNDDGDDGEDDADKK